MVDVAQLVRVPDCDSGCCRFESGHPPAKVPRLFAGFFVFFTVPKKKARNTITEPFFEGVRVYFFKSITFSVALPPTCITPT